MRYSKSISLQPLSNSLIVSIIKSFSIATPQNIEHLFAFYIIIVIYLF